MTYTFDNSVKATGFTRGRGGNAITTIVVHHWDDPRLNPKFDSIITWFKNGGRNSSAHYVVEAGRVSQMVADSDTAHHAGNWQVNRNSIGIECNPRCSEGDKQTVAELINNLQAKYGRLKIIGHMDASSTDCPGRYYPPAQVLGPYLGSVPKPVPPTETQDLNALADAVIRGDYGNGDERKRRLGALYSAVQAIVNRKLAGGGAPSPAPQPAAPDLNALADAVIRGDYGNGDERRQKLGSNYDDVQALVNQKLAGGSPSAGPDLNALADAVIRGDYGNGDERKRRLGANYAAVQALVNKKLS